MEIQVAQPCPQCGGAVVLSESDRLLTCSYCGVKSYLRSNGPFRYTLPTRKTVPELLHTPYLRFKGNIFLVTEKGISYRVVDTTQAALRLHGLPPSLGLRPQAMKLTRLSSRLGGSYLRPTVKAVQVLEKAARLSTLSGNEGDYLYHRAYIGETISVIHLPLRRTGEGLVDEIRDTLLVPVHRTDAAALHPVPFSPRWQVDFLPTLCPHCGWDLDGQGDCVVLTCSNCDRAWSVSDRGLQPLRWQLVAGDHRTRLYIGFWKIRAVIPALGIRSFADFIERTNQPLVVRPDWRSRSMSFWIPACKLRPKIFLRTGRQATIGQYRLAPGKRRQVPDLYPVTLPPTEARQAIKVILAASASSRKKIFPYLPRARPEKISFSLVYLPFSDSGQEWQQPQTGIVINKKVLSFGRKL